MAPTSPNKNMAKNTIDKEYLRFVLSQSDLLYKGPNYIWVWRQIFGFDGSTKERNKEKFIHKCYRCEKRATKRKKQNFPVKTIHNHNSLIRGPLSHIEVNQK